MPRHMIENERSTAINPSEGVEESVSLSDRVGLWIGFHSIDQEVFFQMIDAYVAHFAIPVADIDLHAEALLAKYDQLTVADCLFLQRVDRCVAATESDTHALRISPKRVTA